MKRNENFIAKELMGSMVLVPVGDASNDFNGIITLNESAKFLWDCTENEFEVKDLVAALIKEYDIDEETALDGVEVFLSRMKEEGCIEE